MTFVVCKNKGCGLRYVYDGKDICGLCYYGLDQAFRDWNLPKVALIGEHWK